MKIRCWWLGCESHPMDPAPIEYLECQHCGQVMDYESLAGITRAAAVADWVGYWFFRRWIPTKCQDCGKRYGHHNDCLPF